MLSVWLCLSVFRHSHGKAIWDVKFGVMMSLDIISCVNRLRFDGQGHRSKFKTSRLKIEIFTSRVSGWGNRMGPMFPSFHLSVFPCFHPSVTEWCHDVSWHHRMTSTNDSMSKTTITYTREVRQCWGVFIWELTHLYYILIQVTHSWTPVRGNPGAGCKPYLTCHI